MRKMQSFMVISLLCVLGIYAYFTQEDIQEKLENTELASVVETMESVWNTGIIEEEERLAEAEVTVGVLEYPMPEGLPDDGGLEISCPAEDPNRQVVTANAQNLIMDERLPIESLYIESDVDTFFSDAIFVGDSITVGLSDYYKQHRGTVFSDTTQFIAQVGCSAKMCISSNPIEKYERYMPSYAGRLCKVEDGVALSGAKKVFIDYGLNDLTGSTASEFINHFTTLIKRIQDKNPGVQIYVISTTYVVSDAQTGLLTNSHIRVANDSMKAYCQENGLGYINLADYLSDETGGLSTKYSSDQYVHQNNKSYDIWIKVLRHYAHLQMM